MIEVEVHQHLRRLLRQQRSPDGGRFESWPHQLTMARLVARGLRLQRHALIQVPTGDSHQLSYLLPALMWPGATIICAPQKVQSQLIYGGVPQLQASLEFRKPVLQANHFPPGFEGVLLVDPLVWLRDRLNRFPGQVPRFPVDIPLIVDRAEYLEEWAQQALTVSLTGDDWHRLELALPQLAACIRKSRVALVQKFSRRPLNHFLMHADERALLQKVLEAVSIEPVLLPSPWAQLQQYWQQSDWVLWAERPSELQECRINFSPVKLAPILEQRLWPTQAIVAIGESLDIDRDARAFRLRLGLPDLTALQFQPDRQDRVVNLHTPSPFPAPNNPLFRDRLIQKLKRLVGHATKGPVVILLSDRPLLAQVGAALAAEFGTRVKVNAPYQVRRGILVCDWHFWLEHKDRMTTPALLAIATLPFPSMEDPRVAGRVNYLKQLRQDWFRDYLLPVAASHLQRAVGPLRGTDGLVVILDIRMLARSYGKQLLENMTPALSISEREVVDKLEAYEADL
ncbi:MAG: helicase C-terminal domain-containing protein [Synechococcus sp.]